MMPSNVSWPVAGAAGAHATHDKTEDQGLRFAGSASLRCGRVDAQPARGASNE